MNDLEKYFAENTGRMIFKWKHYFEIYDRHFARFRGTDVHVVEFGVAQGGSLQMWKQYFGPTARIFGVDINPHCKKLEREQIEIFIGDQGDRSFLKYLAKQIPRIDILIDDGGHTMPQQINTFEELFPHVDEKGLYLCEDLHTSYWPEFGGGHKKRGTFIEYSKNFIDYLHAWHSAQPRRLSVTEFTKTVYSLHYYDSILVIEKRPIEKPIPLSDLAEDYPGQSFAPCPICPICAGSSRILHVASNIHPDKPYAFNFRVCSVCGHGWIDPMPTQGLLDHLYARGSRSVIGEWGPSNLTIPEQVCVRHEMKRAPARYFELGVGHGHLYRLFVERGWKCTGVDPGDWASGFPNVHRDLGDVDPALNADLLVAFDVLEHVSDPVSMLHNLWKLAAPKAKLYCAMPNRESLRARRDREKWRMIRPLGHVNYYSRKSITLALKLAGFAVRYVRATDLNELRFPRRRQDIKPALIEMLGLGDQWIVIAERY